ncbi:PREDICTED: zinc finger and SCAN domain-containing protein 1 [Galeopterus variegatus]|uniref:Zinc finger and SCAN domain-containing protein 1 n=1 Tax=Galeopterus variegatus TaxID=482537 RepID=A0ABM0QPZ4_GALVR|nr:PREDICTED: zinc finger and SCAN domain-containing protein 1 [Galeopterus variegatus]XP_008570436.1 PREDICTED: zinc finger and SCAN domain-containing protein 1 [Galeopterus variegatus]
MLPLVKALTFPRDPQTPAPSEQDRAAQPASPQNNEAQRLRFRQFQYCVAGGPHFALGQLWMLCRQWLQPEARSKEQMLDLLVLEQFLGALPSKMRTWVQSQGPRNCREAASLVEKLTQMCGQEVLASLDSANCQDRSIGEEEDRKSERSQGDPSQALEQILDAAAAAAPSGLPEEGEWPEPTQPQQSLLSRAEVEAPCIPSFLGSLAHFPLKPSIWDEPPCGRDSLVQECARPSSDQQAEEGTMDTALQGMGGKGPTLEGPMAQSPQSGMVPGPKSLSALKSGSRKKPENAEESSLHLSFPKHTKGGTKQAATGVSGVPQVPPRRRPFQCGDCGLVFTWVTHFIEHQKIHREEGPFPCPECNKVFLHSSVLAEHRKIHLLELPRKKNPRSKRPRKQAQGRRGGGGEATPNSKRPFQCSICGKAFPWMIHLIDHQKLHAPNDQM